jgi:hypothetical protein
MFRLNTCGGLIVFCLFSASPVSAVERNAVASKAKPAVATSTVKVNTKTTYGPEKLFDGNAGSGWCEGVKGHGEGQSAAIYLGDAGLMGGPQDVVFYISRGLQTSWNTYEQNGRPIEMRIELFAGDRLLKSAEGETEHAFSEIALKNVPVGKGSLWFRVTILKVLPGTKWKDTCISEVRPEFKRANPHNAREFAGRVCKMLNQPKTNESNPGLKKLVKRLRKEFVNYDDEGRQMVKCDIQGISILSENDIQMWASEGGDGASVVRLRRKEVLWELIKVGYFTALD